MFFRDREEAGRRLAERLAHLRGRDVVVVGLPRGGVPVAAEVAEALGAPLDVIVVRKLGVPFQPEVAMGAVGEGGVRVVNGDVVRLTGITPAQFAAVEMRQRREVERRARQLRGNRPAVPLAGRTVVVVDDGIATGSTARAACRVARAAGAGRIVLAVPVAPPGWAARLAGDADELIALDTPRDFSAIGQWYVDFAQTQDDQVYACLERASRAVAGTPTPASRRDDPPGRPEHVEVPTQGALHPGDLTLPAGTSGLVIFAHGSGSSRLSPRNRHVATALNRAGLGTLLVDLLTGDEERDRAKVFDIRLLADRLVDVTRRLQSRPDTAGLSIGYFGASTGAAAALWAASGPDVKVAAIVSRGGRPDLAAPRLDQVRAPTLLIVGGHDQIVLDLNREAQRSLLCPTELIVVPGATHLFPEPGALESVAELAGDWFLRHLAPAAERAR